jgi:hypothetical protein
VRRAVPVLALLVAACSAQQLGRKPPLPEPEVAIEQLSAVPVAARNVSGPLSVHYAVHVRNVAGQPITLKRIDLGTVGYGSYSVATQSRPFDATIEPGGESAVELWLPAQIVDPSLAGANGPVTIRAVLLFDSPAGQLQTSITRQVRSATAPD